MKPFPPTKLKTEQPQIAEITKATFTFLVFWSVSLEAEGVNTITATSNDLHLLNLWRQMFRLLTL